MNFNFEMDGEIRGVEGVGEVAGIPRIGRNSGSDARIAKAGYQKVVWREGYAC